MGISDVGVGSDCDRLGAGGSRSKGVDSVRYAKERTVLLRVGRPHRSTA
jgi:hypothetical protein